jgi:hypothetical protein
VGLVVGLLTKGMAIASEEADKRSWRTLPDEIQIARAWLPAGEYDAHIRTVGHSAESMLPGAREPIVLREGETKFLIERVML